METQVAYISLDNLPSGTKEQLTFQALPTSSFVNVKSRYDNNKFDYFQHLLIVTMIDDSYVFDLDTLIEDEQQGNTSQPKEIDFVQGTSQLMKMDSFINTGITQ